MDEMRPNSLGPQTRSEPISIRYVDSIMLFTGDLPRLLAFYRDVLELHVLHETPQFALLGQGSGSMIGLAASTQAQGLNREPQRFRINFYCDDVRAAAVELEQRGVRWLQEPYQEDGATTATFEDPDGNWLQLIRYPLR